jgi:hypothetical protein
MAYEPLVIRTSSDGFQAYSLNFTDGNKITIPADTPTPIPVPDGVSHALISSPGVLIADQPIPVSDGASRAVLGPVMVYTKDLNGDQLANLHVLSPGTETTLVISFYKGSGDN